MRDFECSKELALKLTDMAKRMRLNGLEMAFSTGNKGAHLGLFMKQALYLKKSF